MEHFVTLERAIACPRASVAVAADTAAQVLTSSGYRRGLGFGPTQSYVRAYRPTWAVALAVILAVPTLGLGLLLLLVRTKDHCNVVIEDGPYGVVALVSGRVPASLPAALEAASGDYPQSPAQGQSQQPPPMLLAPSAGGFEGAPPQSAILRPATPVPGLFPPPSPPDRQYGQPGGYPGQGYPPAAYDQGHDRNYDQGGYEQGYDQGYGQAYPPPHGPDRGDDPFPPQHHREPAAQADPSFAGPPAPVPHRPPSRLAPPMPADAPVPAGDAGAGAPQGRGNDDDPFSSTSGRVPWAVAAGRRPAMPAPAGPPPVSPPAWSPSGAPAGAAAGGRAPSAPGGPGAPVPVGAPAGVGAQPQAGGVATAVGAQGYLLRVDSGEVLALGPFCLLGREPVGGDGDPPAVFVKFDDAKLSVSKTHLAYGVDERGLWVTDRNSTNGTTIIDPTGRRIACAPGAREYVDVGYQVQIGQRRLTVEAPGGGTGRTPA